MKAKPQELNLKKIPEKVTKLGNRTSGLDVFDTEKFTIGKEYEVYGATRHAFEDGGSELCFVLINDEGIMQEVTMAHFKVVK